jgi:hypothetical protein
VKAALASYAENQGAVNSSKRNTAYLLPLNNAPPVLAKEEDTNSPELANRGDHPFPLGHITGNRAVTCEHTLSELEYSDDELAMLDNNSSGKKVESTPNTRPSYENKPILLFNAGLADTSAVSPELPAVRDG